MLGEDYAGYFPAGDDAWSQDIWANLCAEDHARRQQVPLMHSEEALYGAGTEQEWAGFDEALDQWRLEQPVQGSLTHAA